MPPKDRRATTARWVRIPAGPSPAVPAVGRVPTGRSATTHNDEGRGVVKTPNTAKETEGTRGAEGRQASAASRIGLPARDDPATGLCPMCGRFYAVSGRARYCSEGCRKKAWRRRHQPAPVRIVVPPPGRSRRPVTVYECGTCGTRALGEQRCEDCGAFMAKVGIGGLCPHCDGAVAVCDLLDDDILAAPASRPANERRRA